MADEVDDMLSEAERNTETEILEEALSDSPPADEAGTDEAQKEAEEASKASGQARDEKGKFIAKEQSKEDDKADPAKAEKADDKPDEAGQIPSWRLREEAEARRAAEQRASSLEAQLAQINSRLAAMEKPQQTQQEAIDPLLDPEGYAKRIEEGFAARLSEMQLNNNLAIAHVRHGETFEKAYSALIAQGQAGNGQLVQALTRSQNPGEAIVKWYRDQETLKEVGADPAAYKNKILEDAMKDPAFQAKVLEIARSGANGGQQQKQPNVQLPPSLSRASGSNRMADPNDTDGSEEAVFSYAMNGR